ncbi:MAG: hypothetical protein CSA55_06240 [Ilumatobacter coccineus]|uniref:Acetate kinase n=1 Tax=Ilumatobacter coccineus TaxID=467094 RepID=A0A2G6K655_9ACTN|nr:MAG: hypothetical protein CSA55_06240 [Ilumatobacter coccineus]
MATTMGLTPLEGLVMGTRSGDLDPAIVIYLQREAQMSVDEVDTLLNRRSGLAGMCGHNDLRDVHEAIAAGDEATKLALDVYVRRIRHYLGAYTFAMGGIDVVTFTAGVGEHDEIVRSKVIAGLDGFGLSIDPALNAPGQSGERTISPAGSPVTVMVIPTDEELAISRDALAVVSA